MTWKLITPDPNAPHGLSLARVKEHARVSHDDEDLAIDGMLYAAIEHVADLTGRAIIPGVYELTLPACGDTVRFPITPVREVLSVSYTDRTGAAVPFADWRFYQDHDRPIITATLPRGADAVTVTFRAGYEVLPERLRLACLQLATWWYESRLPAAEGRVERVPHHLTAILSAARNRAL